MKAKGLWITAVLVAVALPAYAGESKGKGASHGAAATGAKKQAGRAPKAAGHDPEHKKRKPSSNPAAGKPEAKGGAHKAEEAQGRREEPGRPESSEDVPGKAKGLDKDRPGDGEEASDNDAEESSRAEKRERRERKKKRVDGLKKKWGKALAHPSVVASLKVHARRMARLERIRELASEAGKDELLERVDKLIEKEDERHERHMKVLVEHDPKAGRALEKERSDEGRAMGRGEHGDRPSGAGKPVPPGERGASAAPGASKHAAGKPNKEAK